MRAVLLAALMATATLPAVARTPMVPYTATYDVADGDGNKVGTMRFEFHGAPCTGYASLMAIDLDGPAGHKVIESMSLEHADGRAMDFGEHVSQGDKPIIEITGTAERRDGHLVIKSRNVGGPEETKTFDDAALPTEHDRSIVDALKGDKASFTSGLVFGGPHDGKVEPDLVSTFVTARSAADSDPKGLKGLRSFKVRETYFEGDVDGQPKHVTETDEFENGVTTRISDTEGSTKIDITLTSLDLLKEDACKIGKAD